MAELKFRLFEYDLPKTVGKGGNLRDSNEDAAYHDTGREFTVSEEEARVAYRATYGQDAAVGVDVLTEPYTIPYVMFSKVYGFGGQFANGWLVYWTKQNEEGYIGAHHSRYWHIKRIV